MRRGCGIAFLLATIGFGVLVFLPSFLGGRKYQGKHCPTQLYQPGVISGSGLLSKTVLIAESWLGDVSQIVIGKFDRTRGREIAIVGIGGAAFVDTNGTLKALTRFSDSMFYAQIVDVENDGNCEFLGCEGPARLIGHTGESIWEYGEDVNDAASGDINGDGKLEFVVNYERRGGLSLVSSDGKQLWNKVDGDVWRPEMLDTNHDGKLEILHSNAAGQMIIRDARGKITQRISLGTCFSCFSLCHYPTASGPTCLLTAGEHFVSLYDCSGRVVARLQAPNAIEEGLAWGAPVKLGAGRRDYLAVVISYVIGNKAVFYLFDSKKSIVYEEALPAMCKAIAAVKIGNSQSESILIGTEGKVLRYDLATKKP